MSTNYHLSLDRADGRHEWSRRIHLGHRTGSGMLLQAVVGDDGWPGDAGVDLRGTGLSGVLEYTGELTPTIWTWQGWRQALTADPGFIVLVEDETPISPAAFIELVESQQNPGLRHERQMQWQTRPENAWLPEGHPSHHLDPQGYSFCWRRFC